MRSFVCKLPCSKRPNKCSFIISDFANGLFPFLSFCINVQFSYWYGLSTGLIHKFQVICSTHYYRLIAAHNDKWFHCVFLNADLYFVIQTGCIQTYCQKLVLDEQKKLKNKNKNETNPITTSQSASISILLGKID